MAHFGPIFPILGVKKIFPENPALSCTTSHGILAPCQISKKIMIEFQENTWTEGQRGGGTEGWRVERTEVRTDPILQDPSGYHQVSKNPCCYQK